VKRPKYRDVRRVALYLRVSTAEQAMGHSLDSQRNALMDWAARMAWSISSIYEDAGASGTSVKGRREFQRMIADGQAGLFDAILVLKVDRFARSTVDAAHYRELLSECGIRLLSQMEPALEEDNPSSFLSRGFFDLQSEYYSVLLSHNVARGMATRAQKGLLLGDTPFGYRHVSAEDPPEIIPYEAEAVRRLFQNYAAGNRSMGELADELNVAGFRPRSKRGRIVFAKDSIRGILENPTYAGYVHRHGEILGMGRQAAIISVELWEKSRAVREERARRPQVYGARPARPYLLSGVGRCADCGSPLWVNTISGGRYHYYRCASRSRGDECPARKVGRRHEWPEAQVSDLFAQLELPPSWQDRVAELVAHSNEDVDVHAERRRLRDRIVRAQQGLLDGVLDTLTAKKAVSEAEAALADLKETPHVAIAAGTALTDIKNLWPLMTEAEKHEFVRLVLDEAVVDLRTGEVTMLLPKASFAPLFQMFSEEEGGLVRFCGWRPRWDSNPRSPP
jgi:site-specific DNA recombinase